MLAIAMPDVGQQTLMFCVSNLIIRLSVPYM